MSSACTFSEDVLILIAPSTSSFALGVAVPIPHLSPVTVNLAAELPTSRPVAKVPKPARIQPKPGASNLKPLAPDPAVIIPVILTLVRSV